MYPFTLRRAGARKNDIEKNNYKTKNYGKIPKDKNPLAVCLFFVYGQFRRYIHVLSLYVQSSVAERDERPTPRDDNYKLLSPKIRPLFSINDVKFGLLGFELID